MTIHNSKIQSCLENFQETQTSKEYNLGKQIRIVVNCI